MSTWHPKVKDVLTAHEVVKANSRVRTEGFRRSQKAGIETIREVLDKARKEDDIYTAAAIYLRKLIEKHPFNDGNKRTAIMVTDRFLEENNQVFQPRKVQNTDELYDTIKWELVSMNIEETAHWLETGEVLDDNTT
jgi:death-on-curing family protein